MLSVMSLTKGLSDKKKKIVSGRLSVSEWLLEGLVEGFSKLVFMVQRNPR